MDHTNEKPHASSLDEKAPRVDDSSGTPAAEHGYEGSTLRVDAEHQRWRDGWDDKREQRVLRKMDIRLLPFVSLLYLLSFL